MNTGVIIFQNNENKIEKEQKGENFEENVDDSNSMSYDNIPFDPEIIDCSDIISDDDKKNAKTNVHSIKYEYRNKDRSYSNENMNNQNNILNQILFLHSEKYNDKYKIKCNNNMNNDDNNFNINIDTGKSDDEKLSNRHQIENCYKSNKFEIENKKNKIKDNKNKLISNYSVKFGQKNEKYEEEENEDEDDKIDENQGYQEVFKIDDRLIKKDYKNDENYEEKTRTSTNKKEIIEFKSEYKPGIEYIPSEYRQKNVNEKNNISNDNTKENINLHENSNDKLININELNIKNSVDFKPNKLKALNYNKCPSNINTNINQNFANPLLFNTFNNNLGYDFNRNIPINYYPYNNSLLLNNMNNINDINNQNSINYMNSMKRMNNMNINNMMNITNMNNMMNLFNTNYLNNLLTYIYNNGSQNPINNNINVEMNGNDSSSQNLFVPTKKRIIREVESGLPGYKKIVTVEYKCSLIKDKNNEKINNSNINNKNTKNNKKKKKWSKENNSIGKQAKIEKNKIDLKKIENGEENRTEIIVKNIALHLNVYDIIRIIDNKLNIDYKKRNRTYNKIYLPPNKELGKNIGFFFINFVSPKHIIKFFNAFEGVALDPNKQKRICYISFADGKFVQDETRDKSRTPITFDDTENADENL